MEKSSFKVSTLGIFTAITVLLQGLSYFVKIGTFNLSLVLIPIVLIGVIYGPKFSTYLGFVFAAITYIAALIGVDAGGHILFEASPLLLLVLCFSKGMLCGFVSGVVSFSLKHKNVYIATMIGSVIAPVVNTGVFLITGFLFFKDILYSWAGGTNIVFYVITGLVGVNFIIELMINVILSPTLVRVIKSTNRYLN